VVSWSPRGAGENESNENLLGILDEPVLPIAAECKARFWAALLHAVEQSTSVEVARLAKRYSGVVLEIWRVGYAAEPARRRREW
jgi:hypothetical protein